MMNVIAGLLAIVVPGIIIYIAMNIREEHMFTQGGWRDYLYALILPNAVAVVFVLLIVGRFNLFKAGLRFKGAYVLIGTIGALAIIICRKTKILRRLYRQEVFPYVMTAVLAITTVIIYIPSAGILTNMSEFRIRFIDVFIPLLVFACMVFCSLLLLWFVFRKIKISRVLQVVVFIVGVGTYVQSNFLNFSLPQLSGNNVRWADFTKEKIIGLIIWFMCIAVCIIVELSKKSREIKVFLSGALCIMQITSLLFLCKGYSIPQVMAYSKEGEFDIGKDNVVVFIVDTLDVAHIDRFLQSEYYHDELSEFDYFDNLVGGASSTELAVPLLLSGVEYDPMHGHTEYDDYVRENNIVFEYDKAGFDARLYTDFEVNSINFKESIPNYIGNYSDFIISMCKYAGYCASPYIMKPVFYDATVGMTEGIRNTGYSFDNADFYADILSAGEVDVKYDKAFRLFHTWGVHSPYYNDEMCRKIHKIEFYDDTVFAGCLLEMNRYLDYLKEKGVYDSTTIVIMGDHGERLYSGLCYRPAVLVKLSKNYDKIRNEAVLKSDMKGVRSVCDEPCSMWMLTNLLRELTGTDEHGATIYDVTPGMHIERKHTVSMGVCQFPEWNYTNYFARVDVLANSQEDFEDWENKKIYSLYDSSKDNNIGIKLNELIDLEKEVGYELSMNLRFDSDQDASSTSFCCYMDRIYGEEQTIWVFLGNDCIRQVTVTGEDPFFEIEIPVECYKNDELLIRLVFPDAVNDSGEIHSVDISGIEICSDEYP